MSGRAFALRNRGAALFQDGEVEAWRQFPWLFEPPKSESFNFHSGIVIPAMGATATVVTFTVPEGRFGVINAIANMFVGGGFTDFSGDILWRILRNTLAAGNPTPIRNYNNIIASLGSVANPRFISPIRLRENDVIALTVTNVAVVVAGQRIGGLLGGYFYPKAQASGDQW